MTIQHIDGRMHYRAVLLLSIAFPGFLGAQQQGQARAANSFPSYVVQDLGTLGGPYSFSYNLNDAGVVSGGSAMPNQNGDPSQANVNAPQTAFLWDRGHLLNLGTLGGPNSAGAASNSPQLAVIDSETKKMSRQGEDVCAFGTNLQCRAATWKHGRLMPLDLLPGGDNSYALDMNNRGQAVGFSDTGFLDADCAAPIPGVPFRSTAGFRFQAVIWEHNGSVRQLPALDRENGVATAFGINNKGQVVGNSGVCADTSAPPYVASSHAVLWEDDTVVDLGSLGGPAGASAINNRGDVAGTSATADGLVRPFLWTPESGRLRQLDPPGPPDGFPVVVAPCCKTINDRREIVGFMLDSSFNSHAFLWKDGAMVDLNNLLPKGSPWVLQSAAGINASGQIAGQGLINGEVHAFLATPCHRHEGRGECCDEDDH